MPPPIEQTLHTLLPTCNIPPAQLISLATSLLAQSKAVAPALKADEEIARSFACCHIACQRLANKLALDVGNAGPPCGPRVYKKLHAFLDGILTTGKSQIVATPKAKKTGRAVDRTPHSTGKKDEPSRRSAGPAPVDGSKALGKRAREDVDVAVPEQIMRLIRHLCESMGLPRATLHVFAGLERTYREAKQPGEVEAEVQTPSKRRKTSKHTATEASSGATRERVEEDRLPLLVIALFQLVSRSMRGIETTTDEAEEIFGQVIAFLRQHDSALAERVYEGRYEDIAAEIDELSRSISQCQSHQEWYNNIPSLQESAMRDAADAEGSEDPVTPKKRPGKTPLRRKEKHPVDGLDEDDPGAAGLLPGLGTMFQPAVDWLSDERRAEYALWKQNVMGELAAVELAA